MILGLLLRNWKLVIGAAGIAVVVMLLFWQGHRIQALVQDKAQIAYALDSYKVTLSEIQRQHAAQLQALQEERLDEQERARQSDSIREDIAGLEDGPVAPVLRRTLDRLREQPVRGNLDLSEITRAVDRVPIPPRRPE